MNIRDIKVGGTYYGPGPLRTEYANSIKEIFFKVTSKRKNSADIITKSGDKHQICFNSNDDVKIYDLFGMFVGALCTTQDLSTSYRSLEAINNAAKLVKAYNNLFGEDGGANIHRAPMSFTSLEIDFVKINKGSTVLIIDMMVRSTELIGTKRQDMILFIKILHEKNVFWWWYSLSGAGCKKPLKVLI